MEFCEVASMSMELSASEHFDVLYNEEDTARSRRTILEGIIRFFPWMSTIDSFNIGFYNAPGHSRDERKAEWMRIVHKFRGRCSGGAGAFSRDDVAAAAALFHSPFYYIEYGIAQLGALQLWLKAKEDPRGRWRIIDRRWRMWDAPAAGVVRGGGDNGLIFRRRTLRPLMQAIGEELERLPS